MHRPFVSRAGVRRHRGALTLLLLLAAAFGCQPSRAPLPLDGELDAAHDTRLDAAEALAAAQDDRDTDTGDSPADADDRDVDSADPPANQLHEETLPESDPAAAVSEPTTNAAAATPVAGAATAPTAAAAPPPSNGFALEAPSPLNTITAATPPNVAAATRLADAARLKLNAGDDGAALEQLERAIAIDSGNGYAYFFLAELHLRHRTYDQAIAFAERSAELNAAQPQWASRAYTLQGNAFEAAGRFSDARQAYTRAVRLAPNNLAAASGLARSGAPTPAAPLATAP